MSQESYTKKPDISGAKLVENHAQSYEAFSSNKPIIFQLSKRRGSPSIKGRNYPMSFSIPSSDIIFDPSTNSNRKIKYVEGEASIYVEEQSKGAEKVHSTISFSNGKLIVPRTNPTLKEYLLKTNYFSGCQNRMQGKQVYYDVLDKTKDVRADMKKTKDQHYAVGLVLEMDAEKLLVYAKLLKISTDQSMFEIRHDMKVFAQNNTNEFMEIMDNPRSERKHKLMMAAEHRIISVDTSKVSWVKGDKEIVITNIPLATDPFDYFTSFTYERDGEIVFQEIDKLLNKRINE